MPVVDLHVPVPAALIVPDFGTYSARGTWTLLLHVLLWPRIRSCDAYVAAIDPGHCALYDRIRRLIGEVAPDVEVTMAYWMPTFRTDGGRVHMGAWQHGVPLYGWKAGGDGGLLVRHPELQHGSGTIRLRTHDAVPDDDLRLLVAATLGVQSTGP